MDVRELGDGAYLLKVAPAEDAVAAVTEFARRQGLFSGSLQGIGAVSECEIGFFDPKTKTYERKLVKGPLEVLSLTGNLARLEDGSPLLHAHIVLGGRDFAALGGHLFRAVAHPTLELVLKSWSQPVERRMDEAFGLKLWKI